jgi:hypothetical protein
MPYSVQNLTRNVLTFGTAVVQAQSSAIVDDSFLPELTQLSASGLISYSAVNGGGGTSSVTVVDDLVTGGSTSALSAQQGVVLNNSISTLSTQVNTLVPKSSIVNDLVTGGTQVPLSAQQGVVLNSAVAGKLNTSSVVNDLVTGGTAVPLSAQQGVVLNAALANKAPLASPALTGVPTAPTATLGTNTTQLATMAALQAALAASGRLFQGSGVPSNTLGIDGDGYVRMDSPYVGSLYLKSSGAWNVAQTTTTWAGRPSASSNTGAVITVSDWNIDFYSDGTNWIPVNKRLPFVTYATGTSSLTTGTNSGTLASTAIIFTDTIPAGLVIPGCKIEFEGLAQYAGTSASAAGKAFIVTDSNATWFISPAPSNTTKSTAVRMTMRVDSTNVAKQVMIFASNSSDTNGATTNAPQFLTNNFVNACAFQWRLNANTDDSYQLLSRSITIYYP